MFWGLMLQYGQSPELFPFFAEADCMDTSVIPVDVSLLYDVLLTCLLLYSGSWGITKVIQLFKRR